jgi:acetyl-CoA acetyltransferase
MPQGSAIAGLGFSRLGKVYGVTAGQLAQEAVVAAVQDAGLTMSDVDGLITSYGIAPSQANLPLILGMKDLRLNLRLEAAGATAVAAAQYASMVVTSGAARYVVYVHADAPLQDPATRQGESYGSALASRSNDDFRTVTTKLGLVGATPLYALAARRHMERFGTSSDQLAAIAVAQRGWALDNPLARFRSPLTAEEHQASRLIADPLRLYDCCMITNGAIAFVITTSDAARDLAQPPVHIWGYGQAHPVYPMDRSSEFGIWTGAVEAGRRAFGMAGVAVSDVTQAQLYDCYTFTVLVTLEDYGFCPKGEGGLYAASGAIARGGELPTNTGGGQLSAYYLWGATPLSEAVIQGRGAGGARQAKNDVILVSGNGGALDSHGTVILSPHQRPAR